MCRKFCEALAVLLFVPVSALACQPGYVPSDTPGVCVEKPVEVTNPAWVSDEKPPNDKMPSYQREGIKLINAPDMTEQIQHEMDEKAKADAAGKKAAGIHDR